MSIFHSRYRYRAALAFNYKTNPVKGRYRNVKRHAGVMVRYARRLNKRYAYR